MSSRADRKQRAAAVLAAIQQDDAAALSKLLAEGASTDAHGRYSCAASAWAIPIHAAASTGSARCVRVLIEHGADPDERDSGGGTPLFAARTGEVVRLLVEAGADLAATNEYGDDALQALLIDVLPYAGESEAATRDACTALLQAGVPLVSPAGWAGRLHGAAFRSVLPAVKFLLDAGHPVHAQAGTTALHAICWRCVYKQETHDITSGIIRLLLQAGIDPNVRDEHGGTPLHEALSGDGVNLVAVRELMAAGADVNAQNEDGQTPLHLFYESMFNYDEVVPLMLQFGADPRIHDKWGRSVIGLARNMANGENPKWRMDMFEGKGGPPGGWKAPAAPGDLEDRMIELMERAARKEGA